MLESSILQHAIIAKDIDLIREYASKGFNFNQVDPATSKTALEYALSENDNYDVALLLVTLGAEITANIFQRSALTWGKDLLVPSKMSASTKKSLSFQDRICLLQAGDLQQKFSKITIAFSEDAPEKIIFFTKKCIEEFSKHCHLEVVYVENINFANLHVLYEVDNELPDASGRVTSFPPTTSLIDLDNLLEGSKSTEHVKVIINKNRHRLCDDLIDDIKLCHTLKHELAHAIFGSVHPHDLIRLPFPLSYKPFIKDASKLLDSPDLTVMTYNTIGTYIKQLDHINEEKIQSELKKKSTLNKMGIKYNSTILQTLHLLPRAIFDIGYTDTVVAIEKYGLNLSQYNQIVVHVLQEGRKESYTLTNQGGIGILDARHVSQPAELVMDFGHHPTILDNAIYFNSYLSNMRGLMTGTGDDTIYLGHTDHWVEIQGGLKQLVMENTSLDSSFKSNIIGFRPGKDKIIFRGYPTINSFQDLSFNERPSFTPKLSEHADDLLQFFNESDAKLSFSDETDPSICIQINPKSCLILYNFQAKSLSPSDFQFETKTRSLNPADAKGCPERLPSYFEL